jgi:hypothetical protein
MKVSSSLAVARSAVLALSAGCSDVVQPEPPVIVPPDPRQLLRLLPGSLRSQPTSAWVHRPPATSS